MPEEGRGHARVSRTQDDTYRAVRDTLAEVGRLASGPGATEALRRLELRLASLERTISDAAIATLVRAGLESAVATPAADGTTGPLPRVKGAHRAVRQRTPPERRHLSAVRDDGRLADAGILAAVMVLGQRGLAAAGSAVTGHASRTVATVSLAGLGAGLGAGGMVMAYGPHPASAMPYTQNVKLAPASAPSAPGAVTITTPAPKGKHHRRPGIMPAPVRPSPRRTPQPSVSPARGTLQVSSPVVWLDGGQAAVTLTSAGGPVAWTADVPPSLVLSVPSGTLDAGQAVTVTVRLAVPGAPLQPGTVLTFHQAGGADVQVRVMAASPAPAAPPSPVPSPSGT